MLGCALRVILELETVGWSHSNEGTKGQEMEANKHWVDHGLGFLFGFGLLFQIVISIIY